MKNLKLYTSHSQYVEPTDLPNVSYCLEENEVHCSPIPDYSEMYLTFEALESGTISFNIWKNMGTDMITSISYSTNNGETWVTTNNTNGKTNNLQITVNVNSGDTVLWKGIANQTGYYDEDMDDYFGSFFSSTCGFDAKGNVMSILYGDNFAGQTTLTEKASMAYLFSVYDGNLSCGVVNAENLILPATTLASSCYSSMFSGCTSLTTTPVLPATTLADSCYYGMFQNCTSLTTAPVLPATALVSSCYDNIFNGCSKLNYIKAMFTTTPGSNYTYDWLTGVSSTGTFVKNSTATWNVTGVYGIPTGWTVETASA